MRGACSGGGRDFVAFAALLGACTQYAFDRIWVVPYAASATEVIVTDEFKGWYENPTEDHQAAVIRVVELLEARGVNFGFPYTSEIKGSKHALRELRVKAGRSQIRIGYAFDPKRQAVLLIAGDKTGDDRFYEWFVPQAEKVWLQYLDEQKQEGGGP